VADASDVPASSGEQERTRWQFRDLIYAEEADGPWGSGRRGIFGRPPLQERMAE
jgi:hypothetical protein